MEKRVRSFISIPTPAPPYDAAGRKTDDDYSLPLHGTPVKQPSHAIQHLRIYNYQRFHRACENRKEASPIESRVNRFTT